MREDQKKAVLEATYKQIVDLYSGNASLAALAQFFSNNSNLPVAQLKIDNTIVEVNLRDKKPELAFSRLKNAYINCYQLIDKIFQSITKQFGWEIFKLDVPTKRNLLEKLLFKKKRPVLAEYLNAHILGKYRGNQKAMTEERQIMQFLVWGNLKEVPEEAAAKYIGAAINCMQTGYTYEVIEASEENLNQYKAAVIEFEKATDEIWKLTGGPLL